MTAPAAVREAPAVWTGSPVGAELARAGQHLLRAAIFAHRSGRHDYARSVAAFGHEALELALGELRSDARKLMRGAA